MTPLLLFLSGLTEPPALSSAQKEALEAALSHAWQRAMANSDAFGLLPEDFMPYLATKMAMQDELGLPEEVEEAPIELLVAAKAAARGQSQAIAWIEAHSFSVVLPALSKIGASSFCDEVLQHIRQALFIAGPDDDAGEGRIAAMAGKGDFRGLIRVMAVRAGLNFKRGEARKTARASIDLATHFCEQESRALGLDASAREQEKTLFKAAFQKALQTLDDEARTILRMHLLLSMNISQIADLYHVHRATTARRIAAIRRDLHTRTREILIDTLRLSERDVDSMLDVAQSKIDISFERILQANP